MQGPKAIRPPGMWRSIDLELCFPQSSLPSPSIIRVGFVVGLAPISGRVITSSCQRFPLPLRIALLDSLEVHQLDHGPIALAIALGLCLGEFFLRTFKCPHG